MTAIFLSSSVPGSDVPIVDDRIAHSGVYFGLGVLVMFAFAGFAGRGVTLPQTVAAALIVLVFAATDEFHQSFVPGRDSSVRDFLFDAVGSGFAISLIRLATGARR
jgi:VanZ family protein